jgi:hypothetical protein
MLLYGLLSYCAMRFHAPPMIYKSSKEVSTGTITCSSSSYSTAVRKNDSTNDCSKSPLEEKVTAVIPLVPLLPFLFMWWFDIFLWYLCSSQARESSRAKCARDHPICSPNCGELLLRYIFDWILRRVLLNASILERSRALAIIAAQVFQIWQKYRPK